MNGSPAILDQHRQLERVVRRVLLPIYVVGGAAILALLTL